MFGLRARSVVPATPEVSKPTWVRITAVHLVRGNNAVLTTASGEQVSLCRAELRCLMDILDPQKNHRKSVKTELPSLIPGQENPVVERLVLGVEMSDDGSSIIEVESLEASIARQQAEGIARLGEVYKEAQLHLIEGIELLIVPATTGMGYDIPFERGMHGCVRPSADHQSKLGALKPQKDRLAGRYIMPEHPTLQ